MLVQIIADVSRSALQSGAQRPSGLKSNLLPAISAVSAAITGPPAASATPASTAAGPSASAAVTTTTGPATAASLRLRPRLIHHQIASAKVLPIEGVDSSLRIVIIAHFHKPKSA
jgi:hypothetical protein